MAYLNGVCVDSDILIDYLRGRKDGRRFLLEASEETQLYISVIAVVEIYSGRETRDHAKRELIEEFLDNFSIIELDSVIAKEAGELRRDYQIPFADAIVAASALAYNVPLATRNVRHFSAIDGLEVIQPY